MPRRHQPQPQRLWLQAPVRAIFYVFLGFVIAKETRVVAGLAAKAFHNNKHKRQFKRWKPLHHPSRSSSSQQQKQQQQQLAVEQYYHPTRVIGCDDAGTGCIAGPIVCVSCILNNKQMLSPLPCLDIVDGKRLSLHECERVHQYVVDHYPDEVLFCVATRTSVQIDALGLQSCLQDAFAESMQSLLVLLSRQEHNNTQNNGERFFGIVDGHRTPKQSPIPCRPWKQADETVYTVALASILARALHAQSITSMDLDAPHYHFHSHGAYPTTLHIQKLHQHGVSPWHRRSTQPVRDRLHTSIVPSTKTSTIVPPKNSSNVDVVEHDTQRRQSLLALFAISATTILPFSTKLTQPSHAASFLLLPEPGDIAAAVPNDWSNSIPPWDDTPFPFARLDPTKDEAFYEESRFVEHVDDAAVQVLTNYNTQQIQSRCSSSTTKLSVLDIGCSWTSHVASTTETVANVVGVGMNAHELRSNPVLTDWKVRDLNEHPTLPFFANATFDLVLCQLSIDYFTQPLHVCAEMGRLLKPNGTVHILFSNRLFLTKAIALWTGKDDVDHAFIVASYLQFCGDGLFCDIQAVDLSIRKRGRIVGDPLYVVRATKA